MATTRRSFSHDRARLSFEVFADIAAALANMILELFSAAPGRRS
ncbi:hypothetical protein ACRAWG_11065 [Methylobacterium sp. P31]